MPISHEFEYCAPKTTGQAFKLLKKFKCPRILAGGTDLVPLLKEGFAFPDAVIDIKNIKGLDKIKTVKGTLHIGCLVTFTDLIKSRVIKNNFPLLYEAALTVASSTTRNRATMVGNISSCVPCMDSGAPLMVYEAKVIVKGLNGEREIPIKEWFVAPRKTAIQNDEMVVAVTIEPPAKTHGASYMKLGRYTGEDLAQASVAVIALPENNYRIAFGSVAPVPVRATKLENLLNGREINADLLERAKTLIEEEISPITDIRASKEYRMHMSKVMFERAIKKAVEEL